MRTLSLTSLVLGGLLCFSSVASAHTTDASLEVSTGGYTVDIGYNPAVFTAGQYTRFDFNLWAGATTSAKVADFNQVWIRILHDTDTFLATGIFRQTIGPTTLLYVFPVEGSYSIDASFRDADGNEIASASFPITVNTSSEGGRMSPYSGGIFAALLAGGLLGILGALLWRRKN